MELDAEFAASARDQGPREAAFGAPEGLDMFRSASGGGGAKGKRSSGQGSPLDALAALQTFVGSWSWSPQLEQVLGLTQREAAGRVTGLQGDVLATLCAVSYLRRRLAGDKDAWELMVDKAESWLEDQTGEDKQALAKRVGDAALFV